MFAGVCAAKQAQKRYASSCKSKHLTAAHLLLLSPQDDLRGRNLSDSGERPYALSKTYLLMSLTPGAGAPARGQRHGRDRRCC